MNIRGSITVDVETSEELSFVATALDRTKQKSSHQDRLARILYGPNDERATAQAQEESALILMRTERDGAYQLRDATLNEVLELRRENETLRARNRRLAARIKAARTKRTSR